MKTLIEFGQWDDTQVVLSIGSGAGWWEVNLICQQPVAELILLDENTDVLTTEDVDEAVDYFGKKHKISLTTPIHLLHVDAAQLPLEPESIDQIWLLNSLHEMADPAGVAAEIARVLRPDGVVLVEEIVASQPGETHEGCGMALFEEVELKRIFSLVDLHCIQQTPKDAEAFYLKFGRTFDS